MSVLTTGKSETRNAVDLSSLRVTFISDAITDRNGVGTYYQDLVSYLRDYVARVDLIAPQRQKKADHQGFSFPIPGDRTQRLYFPRIGSLKKYLNEVRPHVAVFPTLGPYSLSGIRHAKRAGAKICVGQHTDFEKLANLSFSPYVAPMVRRILTRINRGVFQSGSMIVTNSRETLETLKSKKSLNPSGKFRLVGTPIPKSFVDTPTEPVAEKLSKVLFLGRLAPEKNLEALIDASRALPDLNFQIGGDGPLRSLVETSANELPNLEFLGWLERSDVMRTIDQTDLLVLPSTVESFGTVAMEALLRERNALISSDCGIKDWSGLAGNLFVWAKGESLAAAIERVASSDHATRKKMAADGREASQNLNRKTIQQWLDILLEMVDDPDENDSVPYRQAV